MTPKSNNQRLNMLAHQLCHSSRWHSYLVKSTTNSHRGTHTSLRDNRRLQNADFKYQTSTHAIQEGAKQIFIHE